MLKFIRRTAVVLAAAVAMTLAPPTTVPADAAVRYYGEVWSKTNVVFKVATRTQGVKTVLPFYNSRVLGIRDVETVLPVRYANGARSCILWKHHIYTTWRLASTTPGTYLDLNANQNLDIMIVMTQGRRCYLG